jgi:phosphoribosylglycinamide formyltransferase-1
MEKIKLGVLISGAGSNLKAIYRNTQEGVLDNAEIVCVISNKDSAGHRWARNQGINSYLTIDKNYTNKVEYEKRINNILYDENVEVVILAGYMKLVGETILNVYTRILNIHPSLLPAFPGINSYKQAFDYGVHITGVTVHLVDKGMDTGKILGQESIRVYADDTLETLSERGLKVEHELFSKVICEYINREFKGRLI